MGARMKLFYRSNLASLLAVILGLVCLCVGAIAQAQDQAVVDAAVTSTSAAVASTNPVPPESPVPAASPAPAAQDPDSETGFHVGITPYIWFAGMHGTAGVLGHDASVHASFGDIFNYLNIGAMGVVEMRYNRVIMPLDFIWMKLSDDKSLAIQDQGYSIKAKMTETILTPKIGYRFIDQKRVKVDALFGIRYWHLSTDLTLQPTVPEGGLSRSGNWVDGVAGAKLLFLVTPKVIVTVFGDAGGGDARSDYQVGGSLGFKIKKNVILQAGYRYMSVNYRPSNTFVYDVTVPGLALGATFNLK
jgi:hypothetical protein